MGNTKNAGKTTALNSILKHFQQPTIITSIGLDGEDIDQVTYLEKPQVYVKSGDIVATAKDTLKQFSAEYEVIENTNIFTAIGHILICRIVKAGKVLVAGPSIVDDMSLLIHQLKAMYDYKIFIDGAFFRQTNASISETTILVIGANASFEMKQTIENAQFIYRKLTLPPIPKQYDWVKGKEKITMIKSNERIDLEFDSVIGHVDEILNEEFSDIDMLYLPKSLTDDFVDKWIQNNQKFHFDLLLKSGVNIQLSDQNLKKLFKLKANIYVINAIDVRQVCINPFSPRGYEYNSVKFKEELSKALNRQVINVKEDEYDE
ncbi:MAG: hypothetical protein ACLFPM_04135 [Candidatus Izemoplasmatales bacterium]